MSDYKLPENFLWGAAIAANQRYGFAGFDAERDVLQRIKFIEKKLMFQQLDGIFLEGLGFFLRQVKAHRDILHLNDGHMREAPYRYRMKLRCSLRKVASPTAIMTAAQPMQAIQVLGPGTVPYITRQRIQLM